MPITLHASAGSCSLAPHIVLEEIGADFSLVMLSTDKGEARSDTFKKINPKGRVPVLIDGDFVLTEAPAILLYLALQSPDRSFSPKGPDGLVRAVEWFNWLSGSLHAVATRMIWRTADFTSDASALGPIREKGFEHLTAAHVIINDRMRERTWAVNDTYSVVDPYLLVFYRWGNRMKINMREKYPAWTDHALRMSERAAVKRALETEGISLWE